jgi:hypothetical protein
MLGPDTGQVDAALRARDEPLGVLEETAELREFIAKDTMRRVRSWIRVSTIYITFCLSLGAQLIYGVDQWWAWVLAFAPLYVLDVDRWFTWKYLWRHRRFFPPKEPLRHVVIGLADSIFRTGVLVHIAWGVLSAKTLAIPFMIGYAIQFFLGSIGAFQDDGSMWQEGAASVSHILLELGRFVEFLFVISVCAKADDSDPSFTWRSALWPSWGVVAAAALTVLVLAPLTCFSMCIDRRAAALLGWVTFSLAGVACSMQVSVGHLSTLLDHGTCVGAELQSTACRGELAYVFVPWIAFFSLFALGTAAIRFRLGRELNDFWNVPSDTTEVQQPPRELLRCSPTYYQRNLSADPVQSVASQAAASLLESFRLDSIRASIDANLCFICADNQPDAVLLECGHAGMCVECSYQLFRTRGPQCPMCRDVVVHVMRVTRPAADGETVRVRHVFSTRGPGRRHTRD